MTPKLDLHGLTWEEAQSEVEREVDRRFCDENLDRSLRIVTGYGAILRPNVLEYLQEHPLVKEIRTEGASIRVILEDLV